MSPNTSRPLTWSIPLAILASCFIHSTAANLVCSSPTSLTSYTPGTPISLGFSDSSALPSVLSGISANLICTSSSASVLTLGSGYGTADFAPKSPSVSISASDAAAAVAACASNMFHVQYSGMALLIKDSVDCTGSFSIAVAASTTTTPPASTTTTPPANTTAPPASTTDPASSSAVPPSSSAVPPASSSSSSATKPTSSKGNGNKPAPSTTTTTGGDAAPSTNAGDSSAAQANSTTTQSSASPATFIGVAVGIVAAVCCILAGIMVWRKRAQKKEAFDEFFGANVLGNGGEKPIFARADGGGADLERNASQVSNGSRGGVDRSKSLRTPALAHTHPYESSPDYYAQQQQQPYQQQQYSQQPYPPQQPHAYDYEYEQQQYSQQPSSYAYDYQQQHR